MTPHGVFPFSPPVMLKRYIWGRG